MQEVVEKPLLQFAAVVGVKMRPVLDAVRLQPFLLRRCAHEALEIAARMQALAAPIGRGQKRHRDLRPIGRAPMVVAVVERMGADVGAKIDAVCREFLLR